MVFTMHGVCGVQLGGATIQLNLRSRGLYADAGAELPKALHRSSSLDIFQNNSHWLVPTDEKEIASWVPNRSCNWTRQFCSVQSLSRVWLFATPWTAACQASLSITSSWNLLKLMSIESVMPSNHLILCRPLLLVPSIFPSIRVFSDESALHIRWTYCSFSFIISPSNENTGLISFRIGLFVNSVGLTSLKSSHQFKLRSSITFGQKCFELWCICWETCSDDLSMKGAWVRHTFPCI